MARECTRYPIAFDTFAKFGFMNVMHCRLFFISVSKLDELERSEKRHGIIHRIVSKLFIRSPATRMLDRMCTSTSLTTQQTRQRQTTAHPTPSSPAPAPSNPAFPPPHRHCHPPLHAKQSRKPPKPPDPTPNPPPPAPRGAYSYAPSRPSSPGHK